MNRSHRKELTPERPESCDEPEREIEDILQEVQSVLKLGRWEVRLSLIHISEPTRPY